MARLIETDINTTTQTLTITVAGEGMLTLDMADVSPANRAYAALHGMKQRICDKAALDKGATPKEKFRAMQELVEHYASGSGEWGLRVAQGEGTGPSITVEAMARHYGGTVAEQERYIEKMMVKRGIDRKAALKVFADSAQIAMHVAQIKAERAARAAAQAKLNADELIEEMDGE
jgi:hypothetical protein